MQKKLEKKSRKPTSQKKPKKNNINQSLFVNNMYIEETPPLLLL
jgi:hypothetical protein